MTRQVLLVDDDDELRLAVDRQLGTLGCDVVVVASGEDAMRVAEEQLRIDGFQTSTAASWRGRSGRNGRSCAWRSWDARHPASRWPPLTFPF